MALNIISRGKRGIISSVEKSTTEYRFRINFQVVNHRLITQIEHTQQHAAHNTQHNHTHRPRSCKTFICVFRHTTRRQLKAAFCVSVTAWCTYGEGGAHNANTRSTITHESEWRGLIARMLSNLILAVFRHWQIMPQIWLSEIMRRAHSTNQPQLLLRACL